MKRDKRVYLSITWVVIGAVLFSMAIAGKVDSFWSGMGGALLAVGGLQILKYYRLNKNEAYREKMEIEYGDERNQFIRNKAWSWSGYLFILIAAVSCIVLKIAGQEVLSMAASGAVCLMLMLYWVSYYLLKRKY